jgi:hypothetical protein
MKAPEFSYRDLVANCHNPIPQPSAFIRRKVMEDVGLLDPHYYYFMDWDFWLRAGLRHSFAYFPELLSTYRLHEESKTVAQAVRAAPELEYSCIESFRAARPARQYPPAREGSHDEYVLYDGRLLFKWRRSKVGAANGQEGIAGETRDSCDARRGAQILLLPFRWSTFLPE